MVTYCRSDKGLALPANQAAGILGFDIEKNAVLQRMFFDGGLKSQEFQEFFEYGFGLRWHRSKLFLFTDGFCAGCQLLLSFLHRRRRLARGWWRTAMFLVIFICTMLNRFCTVQYSVSPADMR